MEATIKSILGEWGDINPGGPKGKETGLTPDPVADCRNGAPEGDAAPCGIVAKCASTFFNAHWESEGYRFSLVPHGAGPQNRPTRG